MYCADFDLKKLFPIKNVDTKPSGFRTNYSATLYHFRILIFGGMNENNQPTSAFDSFDISTYKWEKVITQGKLPAARHSHCAEIVKDQLVVIGGTKACDIFDREGYLSEIHILDMNTLTWTQIAHDVNSLFAHRQPNSLLNCVLIQTNKKFKEIIFVSLKF